jgi:membrane glycosyltransferase
VIAGVAAYFVSPSLAAWMAPVILGLLLSIPIVAFTSSRGPGLWLRRLKIFSIPEEHTPPNVLVRAAQLRAGVHPHDTPPSL